MYSRQPSRILHVDGDTFFASCEVALDASLSGKPVWVGGGRRGDGIVIAANREAKRFGIHTGMACFKAKHVCPHGVLARPQYDEYRRLSKEMFQIMEQYTPTLVPMSIDEGFLDLTTMGRHVWRDTTAADYVNGLRSRIQNEVGLPVSAGLGRSTWMAKLATSAAKPGFVEVPPDCEREFLAERHVSELAGVGKRRERSLAVLGARTFGDVAELSSTILKQKFGIWGQQLWLFANGCFYLGRCRSPATLSDRGNWRNDYSHFTYLICASYIIQVGRKQKLQSNDTQSHDYSDTDWWIHSFFVR